MEDAAGGLLLQRSEGAEAVASGSGRIDCAADYGSTDPCCGNDDGTGTVAPQYVCPSAKPFCVDYVYGSEWGKCTGCDACKDSSMCCNPHDKFFIYSCPGCGSF